MSVSQMSVGQMSVGQMSIGKMSVGQMIFDQRMWSCPKSFISWVAGEGAVEDGGQVETRK